ncbi:MAG: peptidoglycan-binding protein, partial [Halanaerobiaceae bacterium]
MKRKPVLLTVFMVLFLLHINNELWAAELNDIKYKGDLWNLMNYYKMKETLDRYRQLAADGGWPAVPDHNIYRKGEENTDIYLLKRRLYLSADLEQFPGEEDEEAYIFNKELELAVKNFQYRHGLQEDGVVDDHTIAELNVPLEKRIEQLKLNARLMYNQFDVYLNRYILINIPGFELRVIDEGEQVLKTRVIIGKKESKTPVFHENLTYLVFNPSWKIPINKAVR